MNRQEQEAPTIALRLEPGHDFVPAPIPTRIVAYLLDVAASAVLLLTLGRFAHPAVLTLMGPDTFFGRVLDLSLFIMVVLAYWVVVPALTGATPGKMVFNIRVVPERDRPLGLDQVVLREIVGHALVALSAGIGFFLALRDPRFRALNDRLAATRVVLFTPPRPELYRVQDLRTVNESGMLQSDQVRAESSGETASEPQESDEPAVEGARTPPKPAVIPTGTTLYARPEGETAYERRRRAALGPGVEELAVALRKTAQLVEEGVLMPKVLDRKRADFLEAMEKIDLGEHPKEAVRIVVELGRQKLLSRAELERLHDTLKRRLRE